MATVCLCLSVSVSLGIGLSVSLFLSLTVSVSLLWPLSVYVSLFRSLSMFWSLSVSASVPLSLSLGPCVSLRCSVSSSYGPWKSTTPTPCSCCGGTTSADTSQSTSPSNRNVSGCGRLTRSGGQRPRDISGKATIIFVTVPVVEFPKYLKAVC